MENNKISCQPGDVVVIAGFPGTGKSHFANLVKEDRRFVVYDLSTTDFRSCLKSENKETWEKFYVNGLVKPIHDRCVKTSEICDPEFSPIYIIFTSSHEGVRRELNAAGIDFYYVLPTFDALEDIIYRVDTRYDKNPSSENENALNFIEKHGAEIITLESGDKAPVYSHQTKVWLTVYDGNDEWTCTDTIQSLIINGMHNMRTPELTLNGKDDVSAKLLHNVFCRSIGKRVITKEQRKKIINALKSEFVIGMTRDGRIMMVDKTPRMRYGVRKFDEDYTSNLLENAAYLGMPCITISKEDAETLVELGRQTDFSPDIMAIFADIELSLKGHVSFGDDDYEDDDVEVVSDGKNPI